MEAFLAGRIAWIEIAAIVAETLNDGAGNADEIADVLEADRRARERAADALKRRSQREGQRPVRRRRGRSAANGGDLRSRVAIVLAIGTRSCSRRRPRVVAMILALLRDDHVARVRSLHHRQAHGHEGHRVLRRLRPAPVVVHAGARPSTASRRSRSAATADHRHDEPRRGRSRRRRAARVPHQARGARRSSIACAGPAVHFVIAIVLMFAVLFFAGDYRAPARRRRRSRRRPQGAAAAGLQRRRHDRRGQRHAGRRTGRRCTQHRSTRRTTPRKAGDIVHFVVRRGDADLRRCRSTLRDSSADPADKRRHRGRVTRRRTLAASRRRRRRSREAPRQVGDVGWASVKAIGSMFSPAGISNYFRILSGDTSTEHQPDEALRLARRFRAVVANDAVQGGLGQRARAADRDQHLRRPVQPAAAAARSTAGTSRSRSYEQRRVDASGAGRCRSTWRSCMPITVAVVAVLGFIFLSSLFLDITHPVANPF